MSILSAKRGFYGKAQALRGRTENANRSRSVQRPKVSGSDVSRTRGQCRLSVPLARSLLRASLSDVDRSTSRCQSRAGARTHCRTGPTGWAIEEVTVEFPRYGYRRVSAELERRGWQINHKRVQRLMQEANLMVEVRSYCQTTNSRHAYGRSPNLIKRLEIVRPDQVWRAD